MPLHSLSRWIAERGDDIAVVSPQTRMTYLDLGEAVAYATARFTALGIGPGDTVGVTIAGEVDHLIATLALLGTGCVQVALPSHDPRQQREALAERIGCTALLVTDEADSLPSVSTVVLETGRAPATGIVVSQAADDVALLATSSGTTGRTKIIPLSRAQLFEQAKVWQWPPARDVFLRPTPIEYNNSRRQRLYNIVHATTNVFVDHTSDDWFELCHRHGVTRLAVSSMQARRLLDRARLDGARLPEGCHVRIGGSDMPAPLRRAFMAAVTTRLHVTYATSEFGSIATAGPAHNRDRPTSVGTVHGGVEVEIVDDEDRSVAAGTAGRIRARSRGMATRYLDDAAASERAFRGGWFYPGDVGTLDADGILSVEGRADDMMNLASINIFPSEIENTVGEHEDVVECAAFAMKSSDLGDIPMVAVVARGEVDARTLMLFARKRLGVRAPRRVVFVESLPRNSGAKIDRAALSARFAPAANKDV